MYHRRTSSAINHVYHMYHCNSDPCNDWYGHYDILVDSPIMFAYTNTIFLFEDASFPKFLRFSEFLHNFSTSKK